MALNFNVSPYYDDFDTTKNYHRILFKPGYAVQARELTQSQTILQDQITKFGSGIFADGSKVSGGNIFVDTNVTTCKILNNDSILAFDGLFAVGQDSNLIAEVISVDSTNYYLITKPVTVANGTLFSSGETINFYNTKNEAIASLNGSVSPAYSATAVTEQTLTRLASGTYLDTVLNINTADISVGDTIAISSISFIATVIAINSISQLVLNTTLPQDLSNISTTITNKCSVKALEVGVDEGVWFTNGLFVYNAVSSIVPDALNVSPSVVVGFEVTEEIVDAFTDSSLLDPAIGASNYQAPGADRYQVSLNLVTKPYTSDQVVANLTTIKFIELIRINQGVTEDINQTPIFTDVAKLIAQSVYDQAGNFVVSPFSLNISENDPSSANTAASISAGKVYLNGSAVEHIAPTNYSIQKARDTESQSNIDIESYYGNYVQIANVATGIVNFQAGTTVSLYDNTNTNIGNAKVRNFTYNSGSLTGAQYNAYLFDVNVTTANKTFANVAYLGATGFSANVVNPTVVDNNYNSLVFPFPQTNISSVSNINYVTSRLFSSVTFNNGVTTINTTGVNEDFVGGSGIISGAAARQNYIMVAKSTSGTKYKAGQFIPLDDTSNVVITVTNSNVTNGQAQFNIGFGYNGTADIYATISITGDSIKNKTLVSNHPQLISANPLMTPIDVGVSDVYNFKGVYEIGTNAYKGSWNSASMYNYNDVVAYGDSVYVSLEFTNQNNEPDTNPGVWIKLPNSIVNYYTDNGQRDAYYDHGYVTNISGTPRGNAVVIVDYFTHSGGKGAITVNSYAGIDYSAIPTFTSKLSGTTYNLRDVLDFRPRRSDGINVTTFDSFQLNSPLNNPFVNYSYYLSRIDKIVLKSNGQFKTKLGKPSYVNPVEPVDDADALTLFTLNMPAYTFSKKDITITPTNLRRYTMKDIGVLDKRITNIEYYTALSLLEKEVTGSDVTDSTGTQLLFKNGFLVDSFKGQSVGDVGNPDYATSIDPVNQLARPVFTSVTENLNNDITQGSYTVSPGFKNNNYLSVKNNLITFSYNEQVIVNQNVATEIVNVNPFNVSYWSGTSLLSPSSDTWYDTTTQPNVNVVNEDQSAWLSATNNNGFGTQWNDWQFNWSGQNVVTSGNTSQVTRDALAITNVLTAQGLTGALTGGNITVSSTTQILNTSIIPYARSIPIHFDVTGMPPYTILHTFVNRTLVDFCVTPDSASSDGIYAIDIINAGQGYPNGLGQPIVAINGTSILSASATADVVGGRITGINITSPGFGYVGTPNIYIAASNTTSAILAANTGSNSVYSSIRTNQNGHASGTITLPCSDLAKFPTGQIIVEFSDNALNPIYGNSYAKSVFYSQGTLETLQTTVVSTRPPISTPVMLTSTPTVAQTGNTSPDLTLSTDPTPFVLTPQNQASVNTTYTSATTPVYGLPDGTSITITASNGLVSAGTTANTLSVFGSSATVTTSSTGTLYLQAQGLSSPQYDTPTSVVIQIGNIPVYYTITTKVADVVPNQFSFTPASGVALNSTQTSSTVTVSGLSPGVPVLVSVNGGSFDAGTSSLSGTFKTTPTSVTTSGSGTLVVAAKGTASSNYSTPVNVDVTVGSITGTYSITTLAYVAPADTNVYSPNAFSFTPVTNASLNTQYISNSVTLSGMSPNVTVNISASGGQYSIGSSSTWLSSGSAQADGSGNLVIRAQASSSPSNGATTQAIITVGGTSGVFSITTAGVVITSNPQWTAPAGLNNVATGSVYYSDVVNVTGITPNTPVSVTASGSGSILAASSPSLLGAGTQTTAVSGQYSSSQTVTSDSNGNIYFRISSGVVSAYSTTYTTTVSVAGVSGNWQVSSQAQPKVNLGVWSDDTVSTNASTLTFGQGNQMVRNMFNSAGGSYAKYSSICGNGTFSSWGYSAAKGFKNPPTITQYASIMAIGIQAYTAFAAGKLDANQALSAWGTAVQQGYATKSALINDVGNAAYLGSLSDPLSQNFFITEGQFPNGAFISSVDLFVAKKDPSVPLTVRIRPVVNGYPDSMNDIPGSIVTLNPDQINVPDPNHVYDQIGLPTNFQFNQPVYLPAGQYSIMVSTNTDQYAVYASKMGDQQLGTQQTITSVSYAGAFFKSQNSQTWIPAGGETMCFRAYVCDFAGGTGTVQFTSNTSNTLKVFDLIQLNNSDMTFNALDSIDYSIQTTDYSTGLSSGFFDITPKQNHILPSRQIQQNSGDIIVQAQLTNNDRWTSPVIDLERLYPVLVNNYINNYTSDKTISELKPGFRNGGAFSRYITKRVTLANNFDSTGLTVYVDINRQPGTSIEVYYKVLNANDGNDFDSQNYQLMNPIFVPGGGLPTTGPNDWVTDTYQALNITYTDIKNSSVTYNNFKVYAIKICYYSENPTIVPQLKNLRVVATA
jgi:Domain of unknown function (DUF4815)